MWHFGLIIFLFLFPINSQAQKENYNWCFGIHTGISFSTAPPSPVSSSIRAGWSPATVSDANGNLLFYTNGARVWNRNHQLMPNGGLIITPASGIIDDEVGEAIVIPHPGNANQYYIFSSPSPNISIDITSSIVSLRYSIVDMSLDGGLGDVLPGFKNVVLDTGVSSALTVVGNGSCDQWLISHRRLGFELRVYKVSATGLNAIPTSYNSNLKLDHHSRYTELKAAPNGNRLALSILDTFSMHTILVYDFDQSSGSISNARTLINETDSTIVYGIEFAPNSKLLYFVANKLAYWNEIFQVNLQLPTLSEIIDSRIFIGQKRHTGDLQLGPDQKIYFVDGHNYSLGVIEHPDNYGPAAHLINDHIVLGSLSDTVGMVFGLCNPVPLKFASFAHQNFIACELPYQLSATLNADTYLWNTGASGKSITINQTGTYWVKAAQSCGAWRTDTFHVVPSPYEPLNDTVICDGGPLTLSLDATFYHRWSDGSIGPEFTISGSGLYSVQSVVGTCTYNDTFQVTIYPANQGDFLPTDTLICNEGMFAYLKPRYEFENCVWNTGDTSLNLLIDAPGRYWFEAYTPCGTYRDTVEVRFCSPEIQSVDLRSDTICAGDCVSFSAVVDNYPQSYSWFFEGGNPSTANVATPLPVCFDSAGRFTVGLKVSNGGGEDSISRTIVVMPQPDPRFEDTTIFVSYKSRVVLPACASAARLDWYLQDSLVCSQCDQLEFMARVWRSDYLLIATSSDCVDSCRFRVLVSDIPTEVWLPGAFSPNGDGLNDFFRPITDNPNVVIVGFSVFNRFGQRVLWTNDPRGWDGTHNGVPVSMGTYFWYLRYRIAGSQELYSLKGDVTVVR